MSLPSWASGARLARLALGGQPLIVIPAARQRLACGDPGGALTVLSHMQRSQPSSLACRSAAARRAQASALVLQALALVEQAWDEDPSALLSTACALFEQSVPVEPLTGPWQADYGTALLLVGRVHQAVDTIEAAALGGYLPLDHVLLRVCRVLVEAGGSARAERLLQRAVERGPTVELLTALEGATSDPDARCDVRLALVDRLLAADDQAGALRVADRLAADPGRSRRAGELVRAGIRLASGHLDPDSAQTAIREAAATGQGASCLDAALTAALPKHSAGLPGPGDGLPGDHHSPAAEAVALLREDRAEQALAILPADPGDPVTVRLRAAAHQQLGDWRTATDELAQALQHAPSDAELVSIFARFAGRDDQVDRAASVVDRALHQRPSDPRVLAARAFVLASRGEHAPAFRTAEAALAASPALVEARTARALALLGLGSVAAALTDAEHVLDVDPCDPDALFVAGEASRQQGDAGAAVARLDRLRRLAPWHRRGLLALASALEESGEYQPAREVYQGLISEGDRDVALYVAAARLEWLIGRPAQAEDLAMTALRIAPDSDVALATLAEVRLRSSRPAEAEALLHEALEREPRNAKWLGTLGLARLAQDDVHAAIDLLGQAVHLDPGLAWAQVELGEALRAEGRLPEALVALDAAISLAPKDAWPWACRAATRLALDRFDEARADAQESLRWRRGYAFAWSVLGHVHLKTDQLAEACRAFDQAVSQDPHTAWIRAARAYTTLLAVGEYSPEVRADLNQALALDPSLAYARTQLGFALLHDGDAEGAREAFRAAPRREQVLRARDLPAEFNTEVWALVGLREWERAATTSVDVVTGAPDDLVLQLTHGLVVLLATAWDDDWEEPDSLEYEAALIRVARLSDRRHRRHLLRVAERDLIDAGGAAAGDPREDRLRSALVVAESLLRRRLSALELGEA